MHLFILCCWFLDPFGNLYRIVFIHSQICDARLPDLDVDDVIYFENMGAYKCAMASNFNGFHLPKVEYFIEAEKL